MPLHLQDKISEIVWQNGEDFNEIVIVIGCPQLRVDFRFCFQFMVTIKMKISQLINLDMDVGTVENIPVARFVLLANCLILV